jgi:hypothetical protein
MEGQRQPTNEEREALDQLFSAYNRLRSLGWQDAQYTPSPPVEFEVIELGSTGIHRAVRMKEESHVAWIDKNWPSRPLLIKRLDKFGGPMRRT